MRRYGRSLASLMVVLVFLSPLYWIGLISLTAVGSPPPESLIWWVSDRHWENYTTLFVTLPFARYLWNSVVVVFVAVPITLFVASLTGFALTQLGRGVATALDGDELGLVGDSGHGRVALPLSAL